MIALDSYWRLTTPTPTRAQEDHTRHIITRQWRRARNNHPVITDDTPESVVTVDWDDLDVYKALGDIAYTTVLDRKSTRLNSSHVAISYAVFCLKKKNDNDTASISAECREPG